MDIGANIGWFTKVLSDLVGAHGYVRSFEPVLLTFKLLSSNVKELKLENVLLYNFALSDRDGTSYMEIPLFENCDKSFYMARLIDSNEQITNNKVCEVAMKSADNLLADSLSSVSFIKCDVEGHEYHVIKGAKKLLLKHEPALLIEMTQNMDDQQTESFKLLRYLQNLGYDAFYVKDDTLKKHALGDNAVDYFFHKAEHLAMLEN